MSDLFISDNILPILFVVGGIALIIYSLTKGDGKGGSGGGSNKGGGSSSSSSSSSSSAPTNSSNDV